MGSKNPGPLSETCQGSVAEGQEVLGRTVEEMHLGVWRGEEKKEVAGGAAWQSRGGPGNGNLAQIEWIK